MQRMRVRRATIAEAEFAKCVHGDEMREFEAKRLMLNGFNSTDLIHSAWHERAQVYTYWQTQVVR